MSIEWVRKDSSIVFHKTGDESCVIARVNYPFDDDQCTLIASSVMRLPNGVAGHVFGISLKTAEWLALAIAEHNGVA